LTAAYWKQFEMRKRHISPAFPKLCTVRIPLKQIADACGNGRAVEILKIPKLRYHSNVGARLNAGTNHVANC
jgi:hypothetical protein